MLKNKILRNIGLLLISLSIVFTMLIKFYIYLDKINHYNVIDNIFVNKNTVNDYYLGYIYIERVNIKRLIVKDINKKNLDDKYVAMDSSSISLDSNKNIILAGHSIDNVFKNLHNLKINDEIRIITKNKERIYLVSEILIVDDNDIKYMEQTNINVLTLITCMNNSKRRLIIKALPK